MNHTLRHYLFTAPYNVLLVSLLLWVFFLPVAKAPRNIAEIVMIAVACAGFCTVPLTSLSFLKSRELLASALLLLMPLIWLPHPGPAEYGAYLKDCLYVIDVLAVVYCLRSYPKVTKKLIAVLMAGTVLSAVISLLQYVHLLPFREHGIAIGLHGFTLSGAYSLLLAFAAGVLSWLARMAPNLKQRCLWFTGMTICIADLLLAVPGRSGYLAFAGLAGYILYNLVKTSTLFAGFITLFIALVILNSSTLQNRLINARFNIAQYNSGNSYSAVGERFEMWKISRQLFNENPVFGAGTTGFRERWRRDGYPKIPIKYDNAHSTYMNILANYGIAGISILLFFLFHTARFAWHARSSASGAVVFCFLVTFIIGSLTNTMVTSSFYLSWLSIICALMVADPVPRPATYPI